MSDLKQKPFDIDKRLVWEAIPESCCQQRGGRVDGQSIAEFEEDLKGNLYKLWNRLSSGTSFRLRCAVWRYLRKPEEPEC